MKNKVYIFHGNDAQFSNAVFSDTERAQDWISKNKLSGMLTEMPLNISVYEWAIQNEYFTPNKDYQKEPNFIQRFTSASLEHWHFEDGELVS